MSLVGRQAGDLVLDAVEFADLGERLIGPRVAGPGRLSGSLRVRRVERLEELLPGVRSAGDLDSGASDKDVVEAGVGVAVNAGAAKTSATC